MKELEVALAEIRESLMNGQTERLQSLIKTAFSNGVEAEDILNRGLISGMGLLGELFEKKEVYVPDLLLAARSMTAVMGLLETKLVKTNTIAIKQKVIIGTVRGDIHNIGKNLVIIMLKCSGFEVQDLGIDVPPEDFVRAAKEGASLVCMSALLATSLPFLKTTIDALREAGLGGLKTMVGGAVVTPTYASTIGASGYAPNAAVAVRKAKELLNLS